MCHTPRKCQRLSTRYESDFAGKEGWGWGGGGSRENVCGRGATLCLFGGAGELAPLGKTRHQKFCLEFFFFLRFFKKTLLDSINFEALKSRTCVPDPKLEFRNRGTRHPISIPPLFLKKVNNLPIRRGKRRRKFVTSYRMHVGNGGFLLRFLEITENFLPNWQWWPRPLPIN